MCHFIEDMIAHASRDEQIVVGEIFGTGTVGNGDGAFNFVGIYSGRFHTEDANDAQLGRVWPRALLDEILMFHVAAKVGNLGRTHEAG